MREPATSPYPHLPAGSPAVEAAECPQQANSYDCGAYVLAMTRQLAHTLVTEGRLDPSSLPGFVTPDAVTELRRRLAAKVQELIEAYRAQKGGV
jgi:Ulp1 family protease